MFENITLVYKLLPVQSIRWGLPLFCPVKTGESNFCEGAFISSSMRIPTSHYIVILFLFYSRAIYFIICCCLILILENQKDTLSRELGYFKDGLYIFILCFPIIFVLGLLPQVNTCAMYIFEQIDIHIFGGNASSSLLSSIYCLIRSLLAVGILIGFAYGGLTGDEAHSHHTQEILFSIFCGLNVAIR